MLLIFANTKISLKKVAEMRIILFICTMQHEINTILLDLTAAALNLNCSEHYSAELQFVGHLNAVRFKIRTDNRILFEDAGYTNGHAADVSQFNKWIGLCKEHAHSSGRKNTEEQIEIKKSRWFGSTKSLLGK